MRVELPTRQAGVARCQRPRKSKRSNARDQTHKAVWNKTNRNQSFKAVTITFPHEVNVNTSKMKIKIGVVSRERETSQTSQKEI